MKILALFSVFATANALTCSTSGTRGSPPKKCPAGMQCKITNKGMPEADVPNSGICVKTAAPKPSVDYYKAYAAFNAADADHSGTISFGGAYQALSKLFPKADEQTLDRLTKSADKTHYDSSKRKTVFRDGKIDKSEFITLYLNMLHQQHGSSNPCNSKNACGFGQTCYVCKSTKGFCCKKIVTVGPHDEPDGGLSKTEINRLTNLFQAINTQKTSNGAVKNEYLSYGELFAFMRTVAETFGATSNLYKQVSQYIVHSDQDHNSRVTFQEFIAACAKVKKGDPADFPKFLTVAESQHMLAVGSSCVPTGSTKCAKGSSCLPVVPQPQIYDGFDTRPHADGNLRPPPQIADGNLRIPMAGGGRRTLSISRALSYKCLVRPATCEACVKSNGKWFGSHCIVPGEPLVMDAPLQTTVQGCRKAKAMSKAKCSRHKSCTTCTSLGHSNTYGQLCAWMSYGTSGSCMQNQGMGFGAFRPMVTSKNMCNADIVHVKG